MREVSEVEKSHISDAAELILESFDQPGQVVKRSPQKVPEKNLEIEPEPVLDPAQTSDRIQNKAIVELGPMSPYSTSILDDKSAQPSAGPLDINNKANSSFILAANGIVTSSPEIYQQESAKTIQDSKAVKPFDTIGGSQEN